MPPLYRGVPRGTRRGHLALQGIVEPLGTSHDYEAHVLDNGNVATDVTSWTRELAVARSFGDIVLAIDEDEVRDRIVPHPRPNARPHEQEVLIRGRLTNVKRIR